MRGINIKFPFEETSEGGVFALNTTTDRAFRDDLVALLTLRRGHRPMQGKMFSPIYDFLHEPLDSISTGELEHQIIKKVSEFIPQIEIKKIKFNSNPDENLLSIKIHFTVDAFFGAEQTVEINMPTSTDTEDGIQ